MLFINKLTLIRCAFTSIEKLVQPILLNIGNQNRALRSKTQNSANLPLNLTPQSLNLKDFNANRALALTGTFSPKSGYSDHFKAVCVDKPYAESYAQFHNRIFAAWDIETLAINGVERAYIVSWVVSKGKVIETGTVNHLLLDWKTEEGQLNLTKAFLAGLEASATKINGNKPVKVLYTYAHNSGLFDLHVLLPSIIKIHNEMSKILPAIISDRDNDIYQLTIQYKGIRIIFRDRMKILPISLKSVGLNILAGDVGKLSVNHDIIRIVLNSKDAHKILTEWDEITVNITGSTTLWESYKTPIHYIEDYCLQDSIVVVKALKKFSIELVNSGYVVPIKRCITASSIGMSIWKAYFNSYERPIMQIHINTKLQRELNKSYYGGRVEVFNSGINLSPIYHFDVPGLYAGIMQKALPIGNPVYLNNFTDRTDTTWITQLESKGLIGFIKCQVQAPTNLNIPVLPIKHTGKLTFPVGEFTGTWCRVELVKALEIGYTIKPLEAWIFKSGNPLKKYSETLTRLKDLAGKEGNKTLRTVMKLLTNSLYGKFASKYFLTTTEIVKSDDLNVVKDLYKINSITKIDSKHIIVNHEVKPILNAKVDKDLLNRAYDRSRKLLADKDLNVAIASAVTAYGRVQLYQLMQEVQNRGGKVCYTDTDSVFAWIPESPINKPFGPYTWAGPAEEHTLTNCLFIAPKIYYHQDLNGKVTFKVKGVNTKDSEIKYDQLCDLFINKASIKFTGQVQYRRVPKVEGVGVIITENLEKAYTLQLNSKRTWHMEMPYIWTEPFLIDYKSQVRSTAIKQLPECNLDIITNTIKNSHQLSPIKPTNKDSVISGSITQTYNFNTNSIILTLPIIDIKSKFSSIWAHLLSTAAHNTQMFSDMENIKWLQILVHDKNAKVWKTISFFKNVEWIGYTTKDLIEAVIQQIENLNIEYDSAYNWTELVLKLEINGKVELVEFRGEMPIYKLQQDIKIATQNYEQSLALKQELEHIQDKLAIINNYSETTKQIMDIALQTYGEIIQEFTNHVTQILYSEFKQFEDMDEDRNNQIKSIYKMDPELTPRDVRMVLANIVTNSLKILIQNTFKIDYHAWVNIYIKMFGLELTNERHIRHTLTLIHMRIVLLEKRSVMVTYMKGNIILESEGFKTTPYMMKLNPKWENVINALRTMGVLSKTRFIPTTVKYNQDSQDQSLKSIDKVKQLNTLNQVKVFFHPLYKKFLITLQPKEENREYIKESLNLYDKGRLNAYIIERENVLTTILILDNFIEVFKQPFYYNKYFSDSRGRVYPELAQFRHIGRKWLRPLFCLENSAILLETFPAITKAKYPEAGFSEIVDVGKYWFQIAEIYKVDIITFKTPQELLTFLKSKETKELDPQLKVRILEIEYIIEFGYVEMTAPFQIDMKNNAIQHAATIVGNEEAIMATGVLPNKGKNEDIYTKVAKSALVEIQQDPTNPINEEILKKLDPRDPNTLTIIRSIAKRPTIVIIYSATNRTIGEYVYQRLAENKIELSKEARTLLAKAIINKAFSLLAKEVRLMKELKKIVSKEMGIVSWNFGPLTDYVVKDTYFKSENKDIKLSHGNSKFHTSYNVMTSKVNTTAMKNSIFVNIIHSLDALHLILTIKRLPNKNIFPIHDAYLINWWYNKGELITNLRKQFANIHNNHTAISAMVKRLSQTTGRNMRWGETKIKLELKNPSLGGLMNLTN